MLHARGRLGRDTYVIHVGVREKTGFLSATSTVWRRGEQTDIAVLSLSTVENRQ